MLKSVWTVSLFFCVSTVMAQKPFADEFQVVLNTPKGGDLFGSMVVPTGDSVESIVLIIPSSGLTDRNGNQKMMKNNAYRMLAVNLANKNIATLRYDKRGIGASRTTSSHFELELPDHINDVKAWVNYLRRDGRFKKILLLGHGEGSLIALASVNEGAKVSGIISVAGMGRSFDQVLKDQMADEPFYIRNVSNNIIDSLKAGYDVKFVPFYLTNLFRPSAQPFLRSIMKYDPQKLIRNLNLPIAVVQGDTDMQARIEDARLLHAANSSSRLIIIVGMNHVMKNCPTIDRDIQLPTYVNPTLPINSDLVEVISDFTNQIN